MRTRFLKQKEMINIADNKKGNNKNTDLVNDAIRFPQVRLIGPNGEQLGIMSSKEAQMKANSYDLDLLCVAQNANPPVCRIVNYSKYKFEQQKKLKEAKKNQKIVELKEIQLTPQIGQHDLETKARAANKFLTAGNKVKVGVRFRGRQLAHTDIGMEVLEKFISLLADVCQVEKAPALEGRWLYATLAPLKK